MSFSSYVALYDYQASDEEELNLKKGDRVTVINNAGQWWTVRNERGQEGLVPFNYLEEAPAQVPQPTVAASNSRSKINQDEGLYQQTNLVMQPFGKVLRAVARYKYASRRTDELSLEKGEEIIVLEKEGDGWWRGKCGIREGWFPANYVEEVKEAEPVAAAATATTVVPASKKPVICTVVALYSFESGNSEELPFQKGDLMDVIGQPADDPEWWEARKQDGSHGLVPRNYVEVMHSNGQAPSSSSPVSSSPDCPFKTELWFHGKISRQVAERLLVTRGKDGEYLVRDSEAVPGNYSISMKAPDRIKHFRVQISNGQYCIGQRKFGTMQELIDHYHRAPIYTPQPGVKMYLTNGFSRT